MAQHGYLGDGYGMRGDQGDDDYDRNDDREFRAHDRDRSFGDRNRSFGDRERGRGLMFEGSGNRMSQRRDHDDYGDRGSHRQGAWFGDDDDRSPRGHQGGWGSQDRHDQRPSFGGFGNQTGWESQGQRRPSAHPDDHYRSWREKQMQALDRDYQDYCREREQQFHSEFDSWRQNRQPAQQQGGEGGQTRPDPAMAHRMSQTHLETDATTTGTGALSNAPDPGGLASGAGAEVGVGSAAGHEPTSVGSGSELAGATGSMINETAGGASGRRKGL